MYAAGYASRPKSGRRAGQTESLQQLEDREPAQHVQHLVAVPDQRLCLRAPVDLDASLVVQQLEPRGWERDVISLAFEVPDVEQVRPVLSPSPQWSGSGPRYAVRTSAIRSWTGP